MEKPTVIKKTSQRVKNVSPTNWNTIQKDFETNAVDDLVASTS